MCSKSATYNTVSAISSGKSLSVLSPIPQALWNPVLADDGTTHVTLTLCGCISRYIPFEKLSTPALAAAYTLHVGQH